MANVTRSSAARAGVASALLAVSLGVPAQSPPVAYPAQGQDPQQQQRDEGECQTWAHNSTSGAQSQAAAPPPSGGSGGGERLRGAARGAVGGAVIGGIAGDAGTGAGIGAAAGTMAGGARARQNRREAESAAQAQAQSAQDGFYRAFAACMEGRGYTVR
ncbi:glycine zipper family protein [Cupriavidus respiraculi]|uniref:Glycine-zipper-containing OmpA-like membrane domain-containing protein n=1 Tax=Cupriavidus respiraculi TaxID=195930 RepID=A0ABN7Y121_9BURK|nr:glycine zipper family protein [Cupriavidus respiraculi]CAG9166903.1 hypothetical protein LMG21510_00587 [Cupriavidus respiraculi]